MAKCTVNLPEDYQKMLSTLSSNMDEIVEKALKAGAEVMKAQIKGNLESVIGDSPRSTGQLVSSLGISPMMVDNSGVSNVKVGFNEPRTDGDSNAKVANILEYGSSAMAARPFLKPAKTAGKTACLKAIEDTLEEEIGKL
ncbi:MAG: HK97 gp10 family phage protein [Clostridia bacterium]|nr:HK97 gp10 family phage protein [Clostridia bacterium]